MKFNCVWRTRNQIKSVKKNHLWNHHLASLWNAFRKHSMRPLLVQINGWMLAIVVTTISHLKLTAKEITRQGCTLPPHSNVAYKLVLCCIQHFFSPSASIMTTLSMGYVNFFSFQQKLKHTRDQIQRCFQFFFCCTSWWWNWILSWDEWKFVAFSRLHRHGAIMNANERSFL